MKRLFSLRYRTPLLYASAMEVARERERNRTKRAPWVFLAACTVLLYIIHWDLAFLARQEAQIRAFREKQGGYSGPGVKTLPARSSEQESPNGIRVTTQGDGRISFTF